MKENRDKIYLERIIQAIDKIQKYVDKFAFEDFIKDEKTFDATLMQIENIGEMIARLSEGFREENSGLPWHEAIGMRNEIVHGYFETKPEIVWKTIKQDLPELKSDLKKALNA